MKVELPIQIKVRLQMKTKLQNKMKISLQIKMKVGLQRKIQIKKAVCIYWNFHSNKYIQFFNLAKFHPVWVDAALSFPKASQIYARFLGNFFYIGLVLRVFIN